MTNPERILRTLDHHLTSEMRLVLYGRAALALGYPNPPAEWGATMDVDAILPAVEMAQIEANDDFWNAVEATNDELQESGLYITHLFVDDQVILSPDWLSELCEIDLALDQLKLCRPSTEDLILTKMMRVDPQDRYDIKFLLSHLDMGSARLSEKLLQAKVPQIPEIEEAFRANLQWLAGQETLSDNSKIYLDE